jgi:hypothetical protein
MVSAKVFEKKTGKIVSIMDFWESEKAIRDEIKRDGYSDSKKYRVEIDTSAPSGLILNDLDKDADNTAVLTVDGWVPSRRKKE